MSSPTKQATLIDKLLLIPHLVKVVVAVVVHCVGYLMLKERVRKPFKDVVFAGLRQNLDTISIAQEQWTITTSTQDMYLDFAKKKNFQAESTELNSGLRLHWLGPKTSEKILLFFHGGGYALPASEGHLGWMFELQQELAKTMSISVLMVGYTLTPHATHPQQLQQAAEALNWLVGKREIRPSNASPRHLIFLLGDSAGGNMTSGLLSHLLHPHPEAVTIKLSEPLGSVILISPWVSFSTSDDSYKRNAKTDMLSPGAIQRWSSMFLGSKKADEYSEPITADVKWFNGLDKVVKSVLIWGGSAEVFVDSIRAFGKILKESHPAVEIVIQDGAAHDDPLIEIVLRYEGKHEATKLIESWLKERA